MRKQPSAVPASESAAEVIVLHLPVLSFRRLVRPLHCHHLQKVLLAHKRLMVSFRSEPVLFIHRLHLPQAGADADLLSLDEDSGVLLVVKNVADRCSGPEQDPSLFHRLVLSNLCLVHGRRGNLLPVQDLRNLRLSLPFQSQSVNPPYNLRRLFIRSPALSNSIADVPVRSVAACLEALFPSGAFRRHHFDRDVLHKEGVHDVLSLDEKVFVAAAFHLFFGIVALLHRDDPYSQQRENVVQVLIQFDVIPSQSAHALGDHGVDPFRLAVLDQPPPFRPLEIHAAVRIVDVLVIGQPVHKVLFHEILQDEALIRNGVILVLASLPLPRFPDVKSNHSSFLLQLSSNSSMVFCPLNSMLTKPDGLSSILSASPSAVSNFICPIFLTSLRISLASPAILYFSL